MNKIFASLFVAVVSFPIASFACGGGDCSMDLPPPPVPIPGPVENAIAALSEHAGLFVGVALAAIIGGVLARQRKLVETRSVAPLNSPAA